MILPRERDGLFRESAAALVLSALFFSPIAAQGQLTGCISPLSRETDNRDGYLVLFEEAPIHPMELSQDRQELWVVNLPDARVSVFSTAEALAPILMEEIPVGLGPVTIRRRPVQPFRARSDLSRPPGKVEIDGASVATPHEMWVVSQSSNSIFILDQATRRVVETLRVKHEPSGLVFDNAGDFAFVTLSASNQIAKIDARTRQISGPLFEASSPMPTATGPLVHVEEPRAILVEGSDIFVLSFKSGNGTGFDKKRFGPPEQPPRVINYWNLYDPLTQPIPPPDRDLLQLDAADPSQAGSAVLWRMGTINFDFQRGPGNTFYVSNVDFANDRRIGEFEYVESGFSEHRVSYAVPSGSGLPQSATVHIDLNTARSPKLPADLRCAMPNEMVFSSDLTTLYIACYESRTTVVVDVATDTVIAALRPDPASGTGFGPRGLVLDEAAGALYVYNRGDNTVQAFQVPVATGSVAAPAATVSAGFDITPERVVRGRLHHINAANSRSGLESCNSCHIDGHLDGLAWDLGDFTGDLPQHPEVRDNKRRRMTMSLRGIEETPPYHWRGDRADLDDFNPAFGAPVGRPPGGGILGGNRLSAQEMEEFESFVFALSYPPNWNQNEDRSYSDPAICGLDIFVNKEAHEVAVDTLSFDPPPGSPEARRKVSCVDCHSLAGFSGTNNQVNNDNIFVFAEDATQLRGLFDKENDFVVYPTKPPMLSVPATGWGFANTGQFDTLTEFVNLPVFDDQALGFLSLAEREAVVVFLREFDSGIAPASAFAWTLHGGNAGAADPPATSYLIPQADLGNTDLIVRGVMEVGGSPRPIGMLYDPGTGKFATDTQGVGPFTYGQLKTQASDRGAILTFLGTPVGMGYRLGLDREMDFLLDGDEIAAGTSTSLADTDGDSFSDGYERRLGSSPTDADSTPTDSVAPAVESPTIAWVNSTVAKVRWSTDEESASTIRVFAGGGAGQPLWTGTEPQLKKSHVMVVRALSPGRVFDFHIDAEDPSGNTSTTVLHGVSTEPHLFRSTHIRETTLRVVAVHPGILLQASFTVVDENDLPVPGAKVDFKLIEWVPGAGNEPPRIFTTPGADADGVASLSIPTQLTQGSGAIAEVMVHEDDESAVRFAGVTDSTDHRLYFHPLNGQFSFWARLELPGTDVLFADAFELGNLTRWSEVVP